MKTPGMQDHYSRIVSAPTVADPRFRSTILDVVCGLNEEVEWHWTMTNRGPLVSGYSIVRRLAAPDKFGTSTARRALSEKRAAG